MAKRTERLNDLLREEISELLRRQVKDPRLSGFLTVTEVSTSPDLRQAKVFVSIMGSEEDKRGTLEGLTSASGFLRRELKRHLTLRRIPELTFCRDDSIEHGAYILKLIESTSEQEVEH